MGKIYESAAHVVCWVWRSESNNPPEYAVTSAEFLALPRWGLRNTKANTEERVLQLEDIESLIRLGELLVWPSYWTRRWIIQELFLPREITLMFGVVQIPLGHVERFFQAAVENFDLGRGIRMSFADLRARHKLYRHLSRDDIESLEEVEYSLGLCGAAKVCKHRAMRRVWNKSPASTSTTTTTSASAYLIGKVARAFSYNPTSQWSECLQLYHDFDCGEPLDVVYAIQTMVRTEDQLKVNYKMPGIDLIKQVLKTMAKSRGEKLKLDPQHLFLFARLLAKKMFVPHEVISHIFRAPSSESIPSFEFQLSVRLRGVIVSHISCHEISTKDCWYQLLIGGDKASRPLRQYSSSYPKFPSLSDTSQDGDFDRDWDQDIRDAENELDEDADQDTNIFRDQGFDVDDFLNNFDQYPDPEEFREKALDCAESWIKRGFWDQRSQGPVFWERHLIEKKKGVYSPIPRTASPKHRDESWKPRPDERFFVARTCGSGILFPFGSSKHKVDIIGFSEFPIKPDDEIWQIPGMETALIMRKEDDGVRIVSPAYLFKRAWFHQEAFSDAITGFKCEWSCLEIDATVGKKRMIELDFPLLLELSQ